MGAIGVSKGGDLVLSMSTFIPEVTAGVCINGCISSVQSKLNLQDSSIPALEFDLANITVCKMYPPLYSDHVSLDFFFVGREYFYPQFINRLQMVS